MKRPSEKAALILVSLIALVVVGFLAASMAADRRRAAALDQLQRPDAMETYERLATPSPDVGGGTPEAGKTTRAPIDGAKAAAQEEALAEFQSLLDMLKKRGGQFPELFEAKWWTGSFEELSSSERRRLLQLLEANQDLVARIREAAKSGGPLYPLDFSQGYSMELPHLAKTRVLARLVCRDALLQARNGNLDLAVEDLMAAMQLGDALAGEPVLLSQLVRIAIYGHANEGMREALPPGMLSAAQTDALVAQLAHADNREAFVDSLSGESVMALVEFDRLREGDSASWLDPASSDLSAVEGVLLRVYASPIARPWFNNDEATYAEMMAQMTDVAALPYYEAQSSFTQLEDDISNLPATRVISRRLLPALTRANEAQARHEANVDLMQMGLLLEQYYADNGAYPDSLDAIASGLGGPLPADPFSGKPYVYEPSANSFLLYGVGRNQTDDAGVHDVREGDMVWRGREAEE